MLSDSVPNTFLRLLKVVAVMVTTEVVEVAAVEAAAHCPILRM
jgi:hypothetical protein